jgi:hypothetical protein
MFSQIKEQQVWIARTDGDMYKMQALTKLAAVFTEDAFQMLFSFELHMATFLQSAARWLALLPSGVYRPTLDCTASSNFESMPIFLPTAIL